MKLRNFVDTVEIYTFEAKKFYEGVPILTWIKDNLDIDDENVYALNLTEEFEMALVKNTGIIIEDWNEIFWDFLYEMELIEENGKMYLDGEFLKNLITFVELNEWFAERLDGFEGFSLQE